jgi:holo-[acyl-carrier protein] synthase
VIVGFGIDVVEVKRIERLVGSPRKRPASTAQRFLARCFTAQEQSTCDRRRDRASGYAARFAAKEAVIKALGGPRGVRWTDIEVSRRGGPPEVTLTGAALRAARRRSVRAIHLTLTHDAGVAAAAVILEAVR